MHWKRKCAQEYQQVTHANRKAFVDTQKVQSNQCERNWNPDEKAGLFIEKDADNRHNHNVKRGDKSRFADSGIFYAELL